MKRVFKSFSAIALTVMMLLTAFTTAYADTAKMGDTVILKITVDDAKELVTFRAFLSFDTDRLDYLSYDDCEVGITAANEQVEGQFAWASIIDESNVNATGETMIMEITFIAKTEIEDINSEFILDIKDAYNENSETIDLSRVKTDIVVAGEGFSDESKIESKTTFDVREYEGNGVNPETSSGNEDSNVSGSGSGSDNTSSSELAAGSDVSSTLNSEAESAASDVGKVVNTNSNGIVMTYDEAEFAEQPPIKFEQQEKADEHRTLKVISVVAVVFFLMIALIAFIMLKMKKDD